MAALKIRKVRANKNSFREVDFSDGLNIVIAERTAQSSERDSRNGVGKSTLIEVINFCLGSSVTKKHVISHLKDTDWCFSLDLELGDSSFTVSRSFQSLNTVILDGDFDHVEALRSVDLALTGQARLPVKVWKDALGYICFNVDDQISGVPHAPSFRALVAYFSRSGRDAYLDPFTTSRQVRTWQKQVYNSYLVGLNWRHAAEWETLREEEKSVRITNKSSTSRNRKALSSLENERVRLVSDGQRLRDQISRFRVVPEYGVIEGEVRDITEKMKELANESAISSRMIAKYEEQMAAESPGDLERVQEIYHEAGLLFPQSVTRELSEVFAFHAEVTRHRREYLQNEVIRLRARSEEIQHFLDNFDTRRAELLQIVNEGGAIEELGALQVRLGRTIERLAEVDKRISELESLAAGEAIVASGRQSLLSRALLDRAERRPQWSKVIAYFASATEYLYGQPGEINFGVNENGFTFDTKMARPGSNGVENMAVYAYDIAVTQVWQERERRPGFLIHDSLLYEGVDERQIALALKYARDRSIEMGFQYIAFLNSDNIPESDLVELGLKWRNYVKLRLGDSRPEDALLGFRFG